MARLPSRVEIALGRRLLRLPPGLRHRLAGEPQVVDGASLDRDVQFAFRLVTWTRRAPLHELGAVAAREEFLGMPAVFEDPPPELSRVEDRRIPGPGGELAIRVYTPRISGRPLPLVVFFHGGGFVVGGLDSHDVPCRLLALAADCILVAVDYRLAPEHPFPAAVEDAFAAVRWCADNAAELGADGARLGVAGDSAGAHLATVVAGLSLDAGAPAIAHQLLFYPPTDVTCERPSYELFAHGYLLDRDMTRWFHRTYLCDAERSDWRASPLLRPSLEGLPPARVEIAGFDVLRDEGIAYAERLREAGVPVTLVRHHALPHGYLQMTGAVPAARRAIDEAAAALRHALTA